MELIDFGTVLSYNKDQYKRTPFPVKSGDKLEWKRNGCKGSVRAKVIGFSPEKNDYVFVENYYFDWSKPIESKSRVWIKKRSVLRVLI